MSPSNFSNKVDGVIHRFHEIEASAQQCVHFIYYSIASTVQECSTHNACGNAPFTTSHYLRTSIWISIGQITPTALLQHRVASRRVRSWTVSHHDNSQTYTACPAAPCKHSQSPRQEEAGRHSLSVPPSRSSPAHIAGVALTWCKLVGILKHVC